MQWVLVVRHADRHDYATPSWAKTIEELGGRPRDPPLSRIGHNQAEELAQNLVATLAARQGPLEVRCSPYLRCIQTACPLARGVGAPVTLDDGLAEVNHAAAHVAPFAERFAYFPEIERGPTLPDDAGWPVPYMHRMRQFARDLEARLGNEERTIVCVSHAASLALVAALLKEELTTTMRFAPAGVFILARDDATQPFTLLRSGDTNALTLNSTTTRPWNYAPGRLDEWEKDMGGRYPNPS